MKQRSDITVQLAQIGAAALIAGQVAGKATRDAFFLSHFSVTTLPIMVMVASLLSIATGLWMARLLSAVAPARLLPRALIVSSTLLFLEWWICGWSPGLAAILVYLQMAVVGSSLISGFWSLLGDRFDARSAKKTFGRIVAASTFGGVVGGVLADRVGSSIGVAGMLPILGFFHIVCAFIARALASGRKQATKRSAGRNQHQPVSGFAILGAVPYVRNLAMLVLLSTIGAGLLDYVFKVRVTAVHPDAGELVRFFALFYTAAGVATFLVQLVLSRVAVEKLGIAGTVASLPLTLAFGSIGGLLLPGVSMASAVRAGESVFRSSLFKSGYEVLYAAVPRRERRATKTILDVGMERLGDLVAAVLLGAILFLLPDHSIVITLVFAAVLGFTGFWISQKLRRGYVEALEKSLVSPTTSGQISRMYTTVLSVARTLRGLSFGKESQPKARTSSVTEQHYPLPNVRDPILQCIEDLRSPNADTVRRVLGRPLEPILASHVITLLARDAVSADAVDALKRIGPVITGQLLDALLDTAQDFTISRRIPRVLAGFDSQRAVDGLMHALSDHRFELRFHSGRALTEIQDRNRQMVLDRDTIMRAVQQELEISDAMRQEQDESIMLDHVFTLLALILPREPLRIAHRALRSGNDHLKGTSLEYLENVLPSPVWQRMQPLFEDKTSPVTLENRE
jgi:AAA family ATP:ADP antiporter